MSELVSVIVITYNSSNFLIATLESVKGQTYQEIELIISDDYSQDRTISLVKEWLHSEENKTRFVNTSIISASENTGVSANCNRGITAAKSDWIKFIAGDDILLPTCIEDNMVFVTENPEAKVVFSQVKQYAENFEESSFVRDIPSGFPNNLMNKKFTAKDQYEILLLSDRITYTPSYFFNKNIITSVGGYDEENNRIEDYPMWLKLTQEGHKLNYFHKQSVGYRMHGDALNNNAWRGIVRPDFNVVYEMRRRVSHPYLPWELVYKEKFIFMISSIFFWLNFGNRTGKIKPLFHFIAYYLNPFTYLHYLKKILPGNHRDSLFYKDSNFV